MAKTTTKETLKNIETTAARLRYINILTAEQSQKIWECYKTLEKIEEEIFL